MRLTAETKSELIAQYSGDAKNTGHAEAQVAIFTHRISHLTEHLVCHISKIVAAVGNLCSPGQKHDDVGLLGHDELATVLWSRLESFIE